MLALYLHLIFRFFQFYQSIKRDSYRIDKTHTFICSSCKESHQINGEQLKSLRWKSRIYKSTPFSQSSSIVFKCPHCRVKAGQTIQYDYNVTKLFGLFRLQMNESQKQLLLRFLLLGLLPIIVMLVFWNLVSAMMNLFI